MRPESAEPQNWVQEVRPRKPVLFLDELMLEDCPHLGAVMATRICETPELGAESVFVKTRFIS